MKKLPGLLLLIAMPCSVLLFVKVSSLTGSDFWALLAALLLYVAVIALCALVFNRKNTPERLSTREIAEEMRKKNEEK